jgi:glycerophosphoryl diester phosphodiesterase
VRLLAVAHRAGNDLPALRTAVDAGADLLETDVHLLRGRLEVRHGKALHPLPLLWERTGGRLQVARRGPQLLLDEVLDAALDVVRPDGPRLLLDLKGPGAVGPAVARTVHARRPDVPVLVCARWWPSALALARHDWARVLLSARSRPELARLRRQVRRTPVHGVCLHRELLTPSVVAGLREHVEHVLTWPVNTVASLDAARDVGVTGVITDSPDVLAAVARARGPASP